MNSHDIIINIGCSIAGACIYAGAIFAGKYCREQRGHYTGIWQSDIFDTNGSVVKRDEYSFRHSGDTIQGNIQRIFPDQQTHRRWKLYGRLRGRDFFAIFWSIDHSVLSYGCWYLHQTDDFEFDGCYLRLSEGTCGVAVDPIRIHLRKVR